MTTLRQFRLGNVFALLGVALCAGGCASLSTRQPAAENVVRARRLSQQAVGAMQRDDWQRAEGLLAQATKACEVDVQARRHYAEALWHRSANAEAIGQMTEAVRLSGDDPELIVALGQMHLSQNDLDRADRWASRAISNNPHLPQAWALRGDVLRRRGQDVEALAAYHRSLSYRGDNPSVQIEIAEIYRRQGRPQRALATLDSAAEQFPPGQEPPRILYFQGLSLIALQRYDDAAKSLAAAGDRGLHTVDVFYSLANAELSAGRPTSARWAVKKALTISPDHQPSQQLLGRIDSAKHHMASVQAN